MPASTYAIEPACLVILMTFSFSSLFKYLTLDDVPALNPVLNVDGLTFVQFTDVRIVGTGEVGCTLLSFAYSVLQSK